MILNSSLPSIPHRTTFSFANNVTCGNKKKKKKTKHDDGQLRGFSRRDRISLTHKPKSSFYSKSTPTPIQIHRHLTVLTGDEAFDDVINQLESTIKSGIAIEPTIFSSLLETCFQTDRFSHGFRIQSLIPPDVLRNSADLSSKLLRLYSASGLVEEAHRMFDEMPMRNRHAAFVWNSLIMGYVEMGMFEDAMALYNQMEEDGVEPDLFTFPRVLKACAGIGSISVAEAVHRHIVRSGYGTNPFVLNALVDAYAKCGDITKARKVFDVMDHRDIVSWNSIITGYAYHGLWSEALSVFRQMVMSGPEPDSVSISKILSGTSKSQRLGLEIHGWAIRRGLDKNLSVCNSLISLYSNHECLNQAWIAFESIPLKDVVSWNSIIYAYRSNIRVLEIFRQMEDYGTKPDYITFVSLLSACANLGLVDIGLHMFSVMEDKYKIKPGTEHHSCVVNLLGRAGHIEEALEFISKNTPFDGGATVWGALLFCCSLHGNVRVAEIAATRLFDLEADNAHNFELLMKTYGKHGRWDDVEKIRSMMRDRGLDLYDLL